MRNLVLKMELSVDGFVGTPSGDVDWIMASFDDDYTQVAVEKLWQAGVHIMGGNLALDMAGYWPTSDEPFAPPMNEIPKLVFSKSLDHIDWQDTQIVKGDLAEEIARLKQQPGKEILAHGGARFAQSLIRLGLVDEYRLFIHPTVLGEGLPIFSQLPSLRNLELVDSQRFKKGTLLNVYRPAST